jgi:hypothetical protein
MAGMNRAAMVARRLRWRVDGILGVFLVVDYLRRPLMDAAIAAKESNM